MAEEIKNYESCSIKYYEQLLDSVTITDDTGTSVTVPYEAIESFVCDKMQADAVNTLQNSENYLRELHKTCLRF